MKGMEKKNTLFLGAIFTLGFYGNIFANESYKNNQEFFKNKGSWFITADAGAMWPNFNNISLVTNGVSSSKYSNINILSQRTDNIKSMLDLSLGYKWKLDNNFIKALGFGLRYEYIFLDSIKGDVIDDKLLLTNNYVYNWRLNSSILSFFSKVNIFKYKQLMPYINAGLGASFNNASGYEIKSLGLTAPGVKPLVLLVPVSSKGLSPYSQTQLSYNVGAGLDILLSGNFIMNLGYEYIYLGNFRSGKGESTLSETYLNTDKASANTLLIGITYLFDGAKRA